MNTATKKKLAALVGNQSPPSEDEFTIYEFMDEYNSLNNTQLSNAGAAQKLRSMVDSGILAVRKGRVNNRQANIYRPV